VREVIDGGGNEELEELEEVDEVEEDEERAVGEGGRDIP